MRTRSPSSAPPENGDDGSTASTPTRLPAARSARTSAVVEVDLPTPGDPVSPSTCACRVCGASASATSRSLGLASSTREISRATDRASPFRAPSTSAATSTARRPRRPEGAAGAGVWTAVPSVTPPPRRRSSTACRAVPRSPVNPRARSPLGGHVQDQRVALAAAAAQRRGTDAAAPPAQLERQVEDDPGAAHPDRVAEGDGAAVGVDLLRVDAQLAGGDDADRGEGLVELDQVEVLRVDALPRAGLLDGPRGLALQGGVRTGDDAVRADLSEQGAAEIGRLLRAHDDDRAGAVGDLRGRARGDRAVLGEGRLELRQALDGGVRADALVLAELDRVAL